LFSLREFLCYANFYDGPPSWTDWVGCSVNTSLRSRRLVRAGEERASLTPFLLPPALNACYAG
jgi:hypothetical protein